jgi:hypothetical protein
MPLEATLMTSSPGSALDFEQLALEVFSHQFERNLPYHVLLARATSSDWP